MPVTEAMVTNTNMKRLGQSVTALNTILDSPIKYVAQKKDVVLAKFLKATKEMQKAGEDIPTVALAHYTDITTGVADTKATKKKKATVKEASKTTKTTQPAKKKKKKPVVDEVPVAPEAEVKVAQEPDKKKKKKKKKSKPVATEDVASTEAPVKVRKKKRPKGRAVTAAKTFRQKTVPIIAECYLDEGITNRTEIQKVLAKRGFENVPVNSISKTITAINNAKHRLKK